VAQFLSERFPDLKWSFNMTIPGGQSCRRPDVFVHLVERAISIEIDEFSYVGHNCICESRKVMDHFEDADRVPHLFVRFNPDGYLDVNGIEVQSCWGETPEAQAPRVAPQQVSPWTGRLEKLAQIVQQFVDHPPERDVSVVELFY
jgi:hypothetical protein